MFSSRSRGRSSSRRGEIAWFDEQLSSAAYGKCRGTGVLRRIDRRWRIAQYNLTIPIPNAIAKGVVGQIRALGGESEPR